MPSRSDRRDSWSAQLPSWTRGNVRPRPLRHDEPRTASLVEVVTEAVTADHQVESASDLRRDASHRRRPGGVRPIRMIDGGSASSHRSCECAATPSVTAAGGESRRFAMRSPRQRTQLVTDRDQVRLIWYSTANCLMPLVNCAILDRDGRLLGIADLLDEAAGLVVEYDGADHRGAIRHSKDVATGAAPAPSRTRGRPGHGSSTVTERALGRAAAARTRGPEPVVEAQPSAARSARARHDILEEKLRVGSRDVSHAEHPTA